MDLRDYFAAHALIHARPNQWAMEGLKTNAEYIEQSAIIAYQVADAMMKERDK